MIPKVETCIEAIKAGVQGVVILNGKTASFGAARNLHRARRRHADRSLIADGFKAQPAAVKTAAASSFSFAIIARYGPGP
jgi:hypothetical protein